MKSHTAKTKGAKSHVGNEEMIPHLDKEDMKKASVGKEENEKPYVVKAKKEEHDVGKEEMTKAHTAKTEIMQPHVDNEEIRKHSLGNEEMKKLNVRKR